MDLEFSLLSLLVAKRGLTKYKEYLTEEVNRGQQNGDNNESQLGNLQDELTETGDLILRLDEIYRFKYEQQHGEAP